MAMARGRAEAIGKGQRRSGRGGGNWGGVEEVGAGWMHGRSQVRRAADSGAAVERPRMFGVG